MAGILRKKETEMNQKINYGVASRKNALKMLSVRCGHQGAVDSGGSRVSLGVGGM
jgi:hypothetical protein